MLILGDNILSRYIRTAYRLESAANASTIILFLKLIRELFDYPVCKHIREH